MSRYHCCSRVVFVNMHLITGKIWWSIIRLSCGSVGPLKNEKFRSQGRRKARRRMNQTRNQEAWCTRCQLCGRWYGRWLCDCVWLSIAAVNVKSQSDYVLRSRKLSIHNHQLSALIQWNSGKWIVWLSVTNVNVCEQRSPAVTLCPLCGDTLSRNVALSELRRDNGSPSPQLARSPSHVTGQLSTAPPSAFISSAPAWPAWHWTSLTGCVSPGGCPVSGSGSDSLHPRVTRS